MALRSGFGKMTCKEHEQDLLLYYYSELGDEDRKPVQGHLESCDLCRGFLADLKRLLPITIKPDDPPPIFRDNYTQGVRAKLAIVKEKRPWWRQFPSYLTPWRLPAVATALAVIIALTLTLTSRPWRTQELPPKEAALLEVLPIAENLEFLRAMEFLDAMDLLESMGGTLERVGVSPGMSMQKLAWTPLFLMLLIDPAVLAATKQKELPDREMLRMMDFLRDWEMIKNMEMMRKFQAMQQAGDRGSKTATQKTSPGTKKEGVK